MAIIDSLKTNFDSDIFALERNKGLESIIHNIYLTFDVGYEGGYTERILDILKDNQVPAAFFITGQFVKTNPEIIQRMIDEGHIVGNHTPNCLMSGIYKI